jgi:tRNA threonylcarbamoyl adenosine modification protein (Sua5/YciO/YrdC/YwlC family)
MSQFIQIHPENPQIRLINQAVAHVRNGGLIVYPTDSGYALGCHIGDKKALDRMRRIRNLSKDHNFTLVCRDLSELAIYARVTNAAFRNIKNMTPGAYTFIFKATSEVPKRLMHPKRKTIGIRVPDNLVALSLLEALGEPIMSTTLILPGEDMPQTDPYEIRHILGTQVDLIVDGGYCGMEPTSVIDMSEDTPEIIRRGQADVSMFE